MHKLPRLLLLILLVYLSSAQAQSPAATQTAESSASQHQLAQARAAYFRDLQGDSNAARVAKKDFRRLLAAQPHNPVVMAYTGSLLLLQAAHTWAFWNKQTLAQQGLDELDKAVARDPDNLEARFIRGASCWHLPFFFHRKQQAEQDLSFVAMRARQAVRNGQLPPQLGAAALDYYGKILESHNHTAEAQKAFREAASVAPSSPGGRDAASHLGQPS